MCVLLDEDGCLHKRSLVRRSFYNRKMQGVSNTATASNTYSDPTASNTHSNTTYSDAYSDTAFSHSDTNTATAETYPYADTRSNSYSNGDTYSDSDGDRYA